MFSLRPSHQPAWSLDLSDPQAVPNARTALALLLCIQHLPGAFPSHQYDDLGATLAPVVKEMGSLVAAAVRKHLRSKAGAGVAAELGDAPASAGALSESKTLELIGEGLARPLPAFRRLRAAMLERLSDIADRPHPSDNNIQQLSELLLLQPWEAQFLRVAVAGSVGSVPLALFSFVPRGPRLVKVLAGLFGVSPRQINMFERSGALARAGLLDLHEASARCQDLSDLLCLSVRGERLLTTALESVEEMAREVLKPLPSGAQAQRLEWPHLKEQTGLLRAALSEALRHRQTGFNVLLYGRSGTGKTSYAQRLIAAVDACGFSVDHEDREGAEASRADRLASLALSQCFAGRHPRAVLVLDEAEDIFRNEHSPFARLIPAHPGESKAFVNHLLESNVAPVLWISNQADLDPAYLRRFTFCLEFTRTPYELRRKIAQDALAGLECSPKTVDAIARDERVSPALVTGAASFARLANGSGAGADTAVLAHLGGHLRALGYSGPQSVARGERRFDTRYLNFEGTLKPEELIRSLVVEPAACVCLSGPSGTGKTQLAAEIARQLGRELIVHTASTVNSKWYGESERNVAEIFRNVDPRSELLFLDEAEVLLAARSSSVHRADRAVTAEFLRWLEAFEGTFICATNHAEELDPALMRRFTFRVGLLPLSAGQRQAMFAEFALGWHPKDSEPAPHLDIDIVRRMDRLDQLTPGDFANAGRRARRLSRAEAHQWLAELEAEQAAKGASGRGRAGFV